MKNLSFVLSLLLTSVFACKSSRHRQLDEPAESKAPAGASSVSPESPASPSSSSSEPVQQTQNSSVVTPFTGIPGAEHPQINLPTSAYPFYEIVACKTPDNCRTYQGDQKQVVLLGLDPGTYTLRIRQCSTPEKTTCSPWSTESYTQGANPLVPDKRMSLFADEGNTAVMADAKIAFIATAATIAGLGALTAGVLFFRDTVSAAGLPRVSAETKNVEFRIIHTNDMHSAVGTYESLSAYIEDQKRQALSEGKIPVVIDGGDFSSGSYAHVLGPLNEGAAEKMNPELDFLKRHGAITTLGNHEWDATQEGLATMIKKLGTDFPAGIVATNIMLDSPSAGKANALAPYFFDGVVEVDPEGKISKAYRWDSKGVLIEANPPPELPMARAVIRTHRGPQGELLKIGYVGVMGPNAVGGSEVTRKGSGVNFHKYDSSFVAEKVAALRSLGAEVVVGICHGGAQETGVKGPEEDAILAKKIPGIDIVAAGHTHAGYEAKEGKLRFQSQGHGQAAVSDFRYNAEQGKVRTLAVVDSKLVNHRDIETAWIDGSEEYRAGSKISPKEIKSWKDEFDRIIAADARYVIDPSGENLEKFAADTELVRLQLGSDAAKELGDASSFEKRRPLGQLVTTAVREELNIALGRKGEKPVEVFLTAIELIRSEFPTERATTFADVFGMLSRGVMKDADSGKLIPDGGKIAVLEMKKGDLYRLLGLLEFYAHNVEIEATMAYSEGVEFSNRRYGVPLVNNLADFKINGVAFRDLPATVRVGMPAFIAQNFREKAGGFVDTALAHQIGPKDQTETMDILLARYLKREGKNLQEKGVTGTAGERAEALKKQQEDYKQKSEAKGIETPKLKR